MRREGPASCAGGLSVVGPGECPSLRTAGWSERRRLWWLLWAACSGVGPRRIAALENGFASLEEAWSAEPERIVALPGWHTGLLPALERHRTRWGDDPLPRFREACGGGRRLLLPGDRLWPQGMRALTSPPLVLYWQGRGSLWPQLHRRRAIAVVGTRRPSLHGLSVARGLGAALADAGWPVVSGLAEGIDAAVHEAVLDRQGCPVGVLGTPLERVYPRHHVALQAAVARRGLLVSEQPPGGSVCAGHFASRNRLQVALAAAVVVVECPLASGALHSAELAWKQGLPLWVVPADTGRLSAEGSNRLLSRGATPLLEPADLIRQLGAGPLRRCSRRSCPDPRGPFRPDAPALPGRAAEPGAGGLSEADRHLLAAVGHGASLEQLSLRLGEQAATLASRLLQLELAGFLQAEPGLCWRPCGSTAAQLGLLSESRQLPAF